MKRKQLVEKALAFAASWLEQSQLDAKAGHADLAAQAMDKRREYQRQLVALRYHS